MANQNIAISPSVVRYLLVLDRLQCPSGIRTVDVARELGIRKPSAHTMLNNLRCANIVTKDSNGAVHLTHYGRALTAQYRMYYNAMVDALSMVLPKTADLRRAASTLIAEIDEDTLNAMCAQSFGGINVPANN